MVKNPETVVQYWLDQSKEDLKSAEALLLAKRYTWCAFICQQTLEKALKAVYVYKNRGIPPHIHKLERLCQLLELSPPGNLLEEIIEIDKYYIATRYPSYIEKININNSKKAKEVFKKMEKLYQWVLENLKSIKK